MTHCDDVRENLLDYRYELLPDWQRERVAAHLGVCPQCAEAHRQLGEELQVLDAWEVAGPPGDGCRDFLGRLQGELGAALARVGSPLARVDVSLAEPVVRQSNWTMRWRRLSARAKVAVAVTSASLLLVIALAFALSGLSSRRVAVSQQEVAERAPKTLSRPGVQVTYAPEGLKDNAVAAIADVVAEAKSALEAAFPDRKKPDPGIRVVVVPSAPAGSESIVTNRRDTIYVRTGDQGLGELHRPDGGPIGLLCQAVAELYNPGRVPGFDRFVAHRFLAPAVIAKLGADIVPSAWHGRALAADGTPMLAAITDEAYASVHPDFAAVAALAAIEAKLKPEGLRALLDAIPPEADDPFAALRKGATDQDPALAAAFELYDRATKPNLQADGSVLIASFEPPENIPVAAPGPPPLRTMVENLVLVTAPAFQCSFSENWSADGARSLKLHMENPTPWSGVVAEDLDWTLKDWRRFSRFDMDAMLEGQETPLLCVSLQDDVNAGHGGVTLFEGALRPGEAHHISCALTPSTLQGYKFVFSSYFDGRFRAAEVCILSIALVNATKPLTLYLDNLRLMPRGAGPQPPANVKPQPEPTATSQPATAPTPAPPPPTPAATADAGQHYQKGLELKRAGNLTEAAAELRAALAADPKHVKAHYALAWVLLDQKDKPGAQAEFRKVVELAPNSEEAKEAQKALDRIR